MNEVRKLAIERAESLLRRVRTGEIAGFAVCAVQADGGSALLHAGIFEVPTMVGLLEAKKLQIMQTYMPHFEEHRGGGQIRPVPDSETGGSPWTCNICGVKFIRPEDLEGHTCQ